MKKFFSFKGFLRGLVPCIVAITVWSSWAIGYLQGSQNIDQPMPLTRTV
jgi:hypothetical protein